MSTPGITVRSALPWVLIPLAVLLVYWPAIHGGLIMDDAEHITPPALQGLGGLERIWWEVGATPHYYPVLNSVFWLEHRIWGDWAPGYHLINILQHALAACLVMQLARRLGLSGALFAGLLFALHPVHVESVAWISEQKNTLSTLLALAATLWYYRYGESRRRGDYGLATGLFLLALLAKTVVAVVPPAILVIAWWREGRLDWRRAVLPMIPWFVMGAGLGLFSAWFERVHSHAQGDAFHLSFLERALIAGRAVCFYLRTLAWPTDLMFINPRWTVNAAEWPAYGGVAAVLLTGALLLVAARKWRGPLATYLLFVGMLFPILGFLNINWFNFSYVANHFQYLPSIGIIVPFAAALTATAERSTRARWASGLVQGVILTVVAGGARSHATDYRTPQRLYAATLEKNPACWLAHNNLGALLMDDPERLAEATMHFEQAIALKPDHARAHNNYANALLRADRVAEASAHYRTSLGLQEAVPEVHFNYAQALAREGDRPDEALAHFARALALRPDYAEAQLGRADLLSALPGRKAEAVAAYREAIRLNPALVEAYNNLGTLLAGDPRTQAEAIRVLSEAVRLSPDYADARFNLGMLLANRPGQRAEARRHLREAVKLRPDDAEARAVLARLDGEP